VLVLFKDYRSVSHDLYYMMTNFVLAEVFRIPSLWRRVAAELIDFFLMFIIKFAVTVLVVEYLGIMQVPTVLLKCFPCYRTSEVGHLAVFLSHLAQNMSKLL